MLRNLLDEVMRRRLWRILVVAALVVIAAPMLFLKSAPPDAPPASTAAPAAAPEGELPARAQRLLAASGAQPGAARKPGSRKTDPFQGPSSGAASKGTGATATTTETTSGSTAASGAETDGAVPATPAESDSSKTTSPAQPSGNDDASTSKAASSKFVDVRFGKQMNSPLHRRIARHQTFLAGGRVVAIFVKYSPSRDKAVFAIAPKTLVGGDIDCRRKEGVCRYVDIAAGKSVRLTTLDSDGDLVSRRLDVVRIEPLADTATATAASSAPADGSCLLGKILKLTARDMPLASDACQS